MSAAPGTGDPRAWVQVMQVLLDRIGRGELKPGARIPSIAALAAELAVSLDTVKRARRYLARHQVIEPGPGRRSYIVTGSARDRCAAAARAAGLAGAAVPRPGRVPGPQAWARAANAVMDGILDGRHTASIPGRCALAAETGVSLNSAVRAIRELAGRGIIYRVPGRSYHLCPGAADAIRDAGSEPRRTS